MRTRYPVAVHLFFFQGQDVLLLRRFNTGWQDGNYSVPAGHVEIGESVTECAIREAGEEVGVRLERDDLSVIHVMNRKSEEQRIDFFFLVKQSGIRSSRARPGARQRDQPPQNRPRPRAQSQARK